MLSRIFSHISYITIVLSLVLPASHISAQTGQAKADTSKALIEIRFARVAAAPGFLPMAEPRSPRTVYVSGETAFSDTSFVDVRARTTPSGLVLHARLKPAAQEQMVQIRRGTFGAGNELLAIFVDGELVNTPLIVVDPNAVGSPNVDITVPVSPDKARTIADAIAMRWPGRSQ